LELDIFLPKHNISFEFQVFERDGKRDIEEWKGKKKRNQKKSEKKKY
jgi:hypothetical protein